MNMEAKKANTATGECHIMDIRSLKAKLDILEKYLCDYSS